MSNAGPYDELDPYAAPKAELTREDVGPVKTTGIDLATENPFLTIWTRPRATIRGILDTDPTYMVLPLAMIGGVIQTLDRSAQRNAGDMMSLAGILGTALIGGPLGGLLGLYVGGAVIGFVGRLLGGRGTSSELRTALAWAQAPALATIPIWLLQIGLVGHEMFTSETPNLEQNPGLGYFLIATGVLEIIIGIWSFVVAMKSIGEAHRFSAWKAFGSMVLLILMIVVPILLIMLALGSFSR